MSGRAVAVAVLLGLIPASTPARSGNPDSAQQPFADGCRRSAGESVFGTAPEWVYVNADRSPKTLEGRVTDALPSDSDNPFLHHSYDFTFDVVPDRASGHLLATGNLKEGGVIGVEWEEDTLPTWAWPTRGDRVTVVGSWIWDCGHWGEKSQNPLEDTQAWIPYAERDGVRGEKTEIHPPRALFILRSGAASRAGVETRADLFISSDGTPARQSEECAGGVGFDPDGPGLNSATVTQRTTGVAGGCSSWQPVNDRDYSFHMPLPPGRGRVTAAVTRLQRTNAPAPKVLVGRNSATVVVPYKGYGEPAASIERPPMSLGATIALRRARPEPAARVRVSFKRVRINTDLDPADFPQGIQYEPSEYSLYADINGRWLALHELAPGMLSTRAGSVFPLNTVVEVWVPSLRASVLRLWVGGRECDMFRMDPCRSNVELAPGGLPGTITWSVPGVASKPLGWRERVRKTSRAGSDGCGCFTLDFTAERIGEPTG